MAAFLKAQTDAFYVVVDALVASNTIRSLTFAFSARLATIFDQRSYVPIRRSLPHHAPRDHMELDHIRFISEGECSRRHARSITDIIERDSANAYYNLPVGRKE